MNTLNQTNNNTNNCTEQALNLLIHQGWAVIPIGANKKPLIAWKKFQKVKPTEKEVKEWFAKYPTANLAVITGRISNLTVIDVDLRHGGSNADFCNLNTVAVRTGGGFHYYFAYKEGIKNGVGLKQGIDVRSEGGYVICPPSMHQSGKKYEWIKDPEKGAPIATLPDLVKGWTKESIKKSTDSPSSWNSEVLSGVQEGSRNAAAASYIGKLLKRFKKDEWETEVWPLALAINAKNNPPLSELELKSTFESIKLRELQNDSAELSERESLAKKIVSTILEGDIVLFHDEAKEGYASLTGDGREILKLRSSGFRKWVAHFAYKEFDKIAPAETVINVIQTLEGRALFEGEQHDLAVRLSEYQNSIMYDLGDGRVVKIDPDGWSIVDKPPIIFKRFPHQEKQVTPLYDGNVKGICDFVNLKNKNDQLLLQVFMVAAFVPSFPHPLMVLHGPQGGGKTTPMRLLKSLIDPSVLKTLSMPDSEREFAQLASHHHFFFFDNISTLPAWLSDSLAKASTGDGFSKRQLYSDDDDVIYSFQRCMALNGINLVVEKADLLDRSILLGLERITKSERRQEQEFWKKFNEIKPQLLGAIFNAVSQAMKIYPSISLSSYPRMADFTRWGCAITQALGLSNDDFLNAYYSNIDAQSEAAIDASPVGMALVALMEVQDTWTGTPSDLLTALEKAAETIKVNIKARSWPKDPSWLVRRIQVILPNLLEQKIRVIRDDKARPKTITLQKIEKNTDDAGMPTETNISVPTNTLLSLRDMKNNGDKVGDVKNGLSDQSPSPPTTQSVKSHDNEVQKKESLSKAQEILKNNIETEKKWNEAMKELEVNN